MVELSAPTGDGNRLYLSRKSSFDVSDERCSTKIRRPNLQWSVDQPTLEMRQSTRAVEDVAVIAGDVAKGGRVTLRIGPREVCSVWCNRVSLTKRVLNDAIRPLEYDVIDHSNSRAVAGFHWRHNESAINISRWRPVRRSVHLAEYVLGD